MPYRVEVVEDRCNSKYKDGRQELIIYINDQEVISHLDGGEPEDQSFNRDWSWIKGELERAYETGRQDIMAQWIRVGKGAGAFKA